MDDEAILLLIADRLAAAKSVAVLTGAGISAESGLSTFRSGPDALWKGHDPRTLACAEAFDRDPRLVTEWYDWRRQQALAAAPNPGHIALARAEQHLLRRGASFNLITQNVDRLHHRAGSGRIIELHGTIMAWRCTRTGAEVVPPQAPFTRFPAPSPFHPDGLLRPAVVWFGEMLPESALRDAAQAVACCDLFFTIGTSAVVYPAAGFIEAAIERGIPTIEVNPDPTPFSARVTHAIHQKSGQWLPRLIQAAFADEAPN